MSFHPRSHYWLLCLGILAGCSSTQQLPPTAGPIAATPVPAAASAAKGTAGTPHAPDLANPKVTTAQTTEFRPPNPERTELFTTKGAQNTVRRADEHGQVVELKGFINVDQPRVVLSIDNVICAIPEGGEKYGVHVNSIQPPKAILQRGRDRWPVTMESGSGYAVQN